MFKKLVDFDYKRTTKEALGFYLAYLLLNFVVGAVIGTLAQQDFSTSWTLGSYGAVVTQFILGILIIRNRNLYKNFVYIILVLLSVGLSYWGGGLLGLIPLAYLTTR